jgi:proline iminopeptidase
MNPDRYTIQEHFFEADHNHQIYVHDWGNKQSSTPVIFLHGGPGNGCDDRDKRKFDPKTHRVIFIDQRGSGRSMPLAETSHNTTNDLVSDIDNVMKRLGIKKAVLMGGSWGSTLALCFAIVHPKKVEAIIIDGIFTGTHEEIEWLDKGGWKTFFPDIWEQYISSVPKTYASNPAAYFYKMLKSNDHEKVKRAVYEYMRMEAGLLKLDEILIPKDYEEFDPSAGIIEMHYLSHKCFIPEQYILKNAKSITAPVYMIQGRYDMVCTPKTAYELNRKLPHGKLIWTINGHLRQHEASTVQRLILDRVTGAE